jgi:hypothetical protein
MVFGGGVLQLFLVANHLRWLSTTGEDIMQVYLVIDGYE